ncbi:MAG: 4-alpha-glucanotransferase, partial [Pirellulaceae bacterium]
MSKVTRELEQLAASCGILTTYEDVHKRRQAASVESLLAVLGALGIDVPSLDEVPRALETQRLAQLQRQIEPVIIAWDGGPVEFDLTLPATDTIGNVRCTIELEDRRGSGSTPCELGQVSRTPSACGRFVAHRLRLARSLPWGYHRLTIENAGSTCQSLIITAPRRAYSAGSSTHTDWGCFLPLYALRSERNWGAGDFTDLQNLAEWTAGLGGNVIGTLPLLAAFLDEPYEPSPYAPASRLAWNEFYADMVRIPELADCPAASELLQSSAFMHDASQLRDSELVDYRRIMARKRQVLELLAASFFERKPPPRYARFEQFLDQHPHATSYAEFRATYERRQEAWQQWPQPMCDGVLSDDDYDRVNKQYHLYAQWIATEQLESLADAAGGGLYLDLPLGVRPDGYDVWKCSDAYACDASAGSPPDAMWTSGQNWCFPPLHPAKIREQGYRHVRDYLIHHLRLARLLRIDHVMQLHRLYWIPHGMRADQGVYVRYRPEEFYAILTLESHRCQTTLIGENLGTVPPEVNQAMEQHNMQRMYVVQYETASSADDRGGTSAAATTETETAGAPRSASARLHDVPAGSLASLNTHDMPTFAAWWQGTDI